MPMLRSGIFDFLRNLPQDMRRDIFHFALTVYRQHPYFVLVFLEVVDDPHTATLAFAGTGSSELSDPARTGYDFSGSRVFEHEALQPHILVIRQKGVNQLGEDGRFDKLHVSIIRQSRTTD